jgi:polyvinyl alcohol dehydrogenase (cytochrome)
MHSTYRCFMLLLVFFAIQPLLCQQGLAATNFNSCEKKITLPLDVWSSGWSRERSQQRVYDEQQAGLTAADLSSLEIAWVFAFKGASQPRSLPAITSQAIYIGSEEGGVFALDTQSGCGYWRFQAEDQVRTAVSVGQVGDKTLVFFGDNTATVYALDAVTGKLVWKRKLDDVKFSVITGSPVLYQNALFVPVSSWEVGLAVNPFYSCCHFRGVLASLNAATGMPNWKSYSIPEEPQPTYRNIFGIQQYGPSGAGIWSAPTVDEKRQRIYVGTGQNYSSPANNTSDSILAFDLNNGSLLWSRQVLQEDAWNAVCAFGWLAVNCPKEKGHDYDFGAPPMLITRKDGKDVIVSGTKGGMAYAFDPDNKGEILWQKSIGRGGVIGGIHWGMASTADAVYAAMADSDAPLLTKTPGEPKPGLSKLDVRTGETAWHINTQSYCNGKDKCRSGISAAITGIPGAILAPVLDGILRAYDTGDGHLLWQFDSTKEMMGVNDVQGHGGTLDAGGVVVSHGMLFFNSGYGGLISSGGKGGNLFYVLKKKNTEGSSLQP